MPRCHCYFKAAPMWAEMVSGWKQWQSCSEAQGGWWVSLDTLLQHSFRHWTQLLDRPGRHFLPLQSQRWHHGSIISHLHQLILMATTQQVLFEVLFLALGRVTLWRCTAHPPRYLPWACTLGIQQQTREPSSLTPFSLTLAQAQFLGSTKKGWGLQKRQEKQYGISANNSLKPLKKSQGSSKEKYRVVFQRTSRKKMKGSLKTEPGYPP